MMKKLEKIIDAHLEVQILNQKWGTDLISLQSTNSRVLIEWKLKIELIKAIQSLRLGQ